VVATTPQSGSAGVASNATVSVLFSSAPAPNGPHPTLDPPIAGHWTASGTNSLVFAAKAPLVPGSSETITVPGGTSGVRGVSGQHLSKKVTTSFTVAGGSTTRLQQLLAQLGYLPLAYVPPTVAPADLAEPQAGPLTWRWNMPTSLTSLWIAGSPNVITKGAVMSFERQNGLTVDGVAGPKVWKSLLADVVSHRGDTTPYAYVFVSKSPLPETLTLYVNGAVKNGGVLVNTGAPGATTLDGTYAVFEHVKASDMKGTNITGSTYDDPTVPWASYFNGGDALHGFVRSHYGYPQSNGCVEMPISEAAAVWPYTPVGTLVTVVGLPNTPPKPPATTTTTTTTAPPPATTTTAPPPPAPATTTPAPATPPA
jgi:peptidoglycan hydrolase-like protein with peptidoglycan-binding domain